MKRLMLVLCLGACGGGSEEEPPPVVTGGDTVTITLHWSYVAGPNCSRPVSCDGTCNESCSNGCENLSCSMACEGAYVQRCCSATKVAYASNTNKVYTDYARCDISMPASGLLAVDCPVDGAIPVYSSSGLVSGTAYAYTTGGDCGWQPNYPGP